MLVYSIFQDLNLLDIVPNSDMIRSINDSNIYILLIIMVSLSFVLRLIGIGFVLYYRCLILSIDRRWKNEREDSFINEINEQRYLSKISPFTNTTITFDVAKRTTYDQSNNNIITNTNEENVINENFNLYTSFNFIDYANEAKLIENNSNLINRIRQVNLFIIRKTQARHFLRQI